MKAELLVIVDHKASVNSCQKGGLKSLIVIIGLLIGVAFATLLERKVMAAMQKRRGPNVVGFVGLLQPLADGLKLVLKETIIPIVADKIIYAIAPILTFTISIVLWSVIAVGVQSVFASINSGVIFILAISSIGVYGIILAGWASNSKYAFLGGLRSAAQMVSYEVALGLIILSIITYAGTVNLQEIMENQEKVWFIIPLLPGFLLAFISALAETNRPPFDLPEAEAELVSGYNVEYSSTGFALFFLGEYANIILMSVLLSVFFLGGIVSNKILGAMKGVGMLCSFIWVRATLPRYRYDQLMYLGWKSLLPFALLIYIGMSTLGLLIMLLGIIIMCTLVILRSVNPIYSILNLIVIYGCYASILLTVEMEFLACIYILVNVGAIAVLFLFIVMMININIVEIQETMKKYNIYMIVGIIGLVGLMGILITNYQIKLKEEVIADFSMFLTNSEVVHLQATPSYLDFYSLFVETTDIRTMGSNVIYGSYSIWFIMACIILLIGMVGVIYITEDLIIEKRTLNERRRQDINSQVLREYKITIRNYREILGTKDYRFDSYQSERVLKYNS
ncbi:hypothetical protein ACTFIR_012889 [Dictyostelium discoideum]